MLLSVKRNVFCFVVLLAILKQRATEAKNGEPSVTKVYLKEKIIEYINSINTTWKAGHNFASRNNRPHVHSLLGSVIDDEKPDYFPRRKVIENIAELPAEFDSRIKWPKCRSISVIRDQGNCASCWAVTAAETISDRICIHSKNEDEYVYLSEQDILSCCLSDGCFLGGKSEVAWGYWKQQGIVSGAPYGSSDVACIPYDIPPCSHHVAGRYPECSGVPTISKCAEQCNATSKLNYLQDKHFGNTIYYVESNEDQIKAEIFAKGPVHASFKTYEDLFYYKSGVYTHTTGNYVAGHSVKIIGWGVENQIPYWLIANSWNTDWGSSGWFKMLRGKNECGIEDRVIAGIPKSN